MDTLHIFTMLKKINEDYYKIHKPIDVWYKQQEVIMWV